MKNYKETLIDDSYYISQREIEDYHPLGSKNAKHHRIYETAAILVSERHDKYELVDLVNVLLRRIHGKEVTNGK